MADRRTGACSSAFAALFILLAISSKIYAHTITPKCDLHGKRPVEGLTNFTWNMFKPLGQFTIRRKPSKGTMITSAFRKHRTFVSIIPGLLLLCGDIISQPGPAANAGLRHSSIKCLGINVRSIKSTHKVGSAIICNSERVQDLAYSENADIVFINETWLNSSISDEEVLSPNEAGVFSDHGVVCFEFSAFVKAPSKFHRSVYNYTKADFDGLRASLSALELTMSSNENSDIDTDWQNWKDLFLAAVADHVPSKKLRGRNPVPWMNGTILDLIKKKETTRRRLKKTPAKASLREKFKALRLYGNRKSTHWFPGPHATKNHS
ncbi:predicted protein [Nematostella vectensis]|uniref:Endonuclease/exonuclease/phosphatase domain-containing protein n=1 Tax=Nematostella vectensis TaxID=45351 RepID=A7T4J8_NEMVE|nr:predicted protein [Nematostella vectensis]|eukprot:XP_001621215.1 hypothetical protein NEMVEDRAFT_v1g222239 [Nematostella vectensis]